jgi:hypothetical protein
MVQRARLHPYGVRAARPELGPSAWGSLPFAVLCWAVCVHSAAPEPRERRIVLILGFALVATSVFFALGLDRSANSVSAAAHRMIDRAVAPLLPPNRSAPGCPDPRI